MEPKGGFSRTMRVVTVLPSQTPLNLSIPGIMPANGQSNKLHSIDTPAHEWYRFVLSFSPQLVRHYLEKFGSEKDTVLLDPFCGTGTSPVESKKVGITSIGMEANPMAHFASAVKVDWSVDPDEILQRFSRITEHVRRVFARSSIDDEAVDGRFQGELRGFDEEARRLILRDSISPLPLHKSLILLEAIRKFGGRHELLALAKALVYEISNLHFGPEVGLGKIKQDTKVLAPWANNVLRMAEDLRVLKGRQRTKVKILRQDSRSFDGLASESVDIVITSPPYPNEKDYTRTTRLESVLLGFLKSKDELRALKKGLVRSNTRGVYRGDDDDYWIREHKEINGIAEEIEARRIALGKTSGFERMYPRVTKLYFGGMAKHLSELRRVLKPGARLAYVVGDQASYLRVMIRTGRLISEIADTLGYQVEAIDLFRTRMATATRMQLREEVVVLRWPGK